MKHQTQMFVCSLKHEALLDSTRAIFPSAFCNPCTPTFTLMYYVWYLCKNKTSKTIVIFL